MEHEITAPGQTTFLGIVSPLAFGNGKDRARTPICVALTDRTMGIAYKRGALGDRVTHLVNRSEVTSTHAADTGNGLDCIIENSRSGRLEFLLASEEDRWQLMSWARDGGDVSAS